MACQHLAQLTDDIPALPRSRMDFPLGESPRIRRLAGLQNRPPDRRSICQFPPTGREVADSDICPNVASSAPIIHIIGTYVRNLSFAVALPT